MLDWLQGAVYIRCRRTFTISDHAAWDKYILVKTGRFHCSGECSWLGKGRPTYVMASIKMVTLEYM